MNNEESESKIALVTGSSTGIGAATAIELARQGFRLIIHGRSDSKSLTEVKTSIESFGGEAKPIFCDFSDTSKLKQFAGTSWSLYGRVDVLVNNAGGDVLTNDWIGHRFEDRLAYLLATDVTATLMLSRSFGNMMCKLCHSEKHSPGSCSIINIGWDQAAQGMAGESGEMFATTKGAIMSMTRSLAQSLAPHVRVNCVAPGWVKTKWGEHASEEWQIRGRQESLMERWGTPQDVADAIAFLASEKSRFISGQIIPVNGGFKYFQEKEN